MGRRVVTLLLIITVLWINIAAAAALPPQVDAKAAILMVADTKQVLFGKRPNDMMYPASTTKLMTLLTTLEHANLNSIVTVSSTAASCEGSSLELKAGDKLKLRDALYGMMLVSGNDAAEAIAENVAGSIPNFVKIMNHSAEKIGALHTHFTNPHGLPDPLNHFTTAYDLALITASGMKNPEFAKVVATREYKVRFLNRNAMRVTNTNKLLNTYPGANGGKTGYTEAAGECLVAAAKRDGVQLIVVVLNSEYRWDDAAKLLDYGFQQLRLTAAGTPNIIAEA